MNHLSINYKKSLNEGNADPSANICFRFRIMGIGKLLSEIWRIKGLAKQEYGPQHPITKKQSGMQSDTQGLLQEGTGKL